MKVPSLDLRSKIFLGSGLLVVPLTITLLFLYQYETAQIQAAQAEVLGLTVTRPVVDVLIQWSALPIGAPAPPGVNTAWAQAAEGLATSGPALGFTEAGFRANDRPWVDPRTLGTQVAAGPASAEASGAVSTALTTVVTALADTSGLVLDPDLDSYYLMLALYQELPDLVHGLSGLKTTLASPPDPNERLVLFALGQEIRSASAKVSRQTTLSLRYLDRGWVPVPGFAPAMEPVLGPLKAAGEALAAEVTAQAAGTKEADRPGLLAAIGPLATLAARFHTAGSEALQTMIEGRIQVFQRQLALALALAFAGLVLATVVLLVIGGGIRRRSARLVKALGTLAQGDLTQPVDPGLLASGDELGRLAHSVHQLRVDLGAAVMAIARVNGQLAAMGSTLAATAEESASAIEEMTATSAQVADLARTQLRQTEEAGKTVQAIIDGISESNDLTQSMAGQFFMFSQAMEASRRRIQETSAEAQVTGGLAEALGRTGTEGERTLEALRTDIAGVALRSHEIEAIVKFILDIAERTNLLSMNAGIEAAHAGTSGRGFKVVADEIRKLAETSSTQAQNIRSLVEAIGSATAQTQSRAEVTLKAFATLSRDIAQVKHAAQAIARQIVDQEAQDRVATAGLEEFTRFYTDLSGTMELQVSQSADVHQSLVNLEIASRQITGAMVEQKTGMDQASSAVVQMRDTSMEVARILEEMTELMARFRA